MQIMTSQSRSVICVLEKVWFKGDDNYYYPCTISNDAVLGVPLWTVHDDLKQTMVPDNTIDIGNQRIGFAFWLKSAPEPVGDGLYHQIILTATDPPDVGYVWTDYAQTSTAPTVYRTVNQARVDGGLYLSDPAQHHKFTIAGGIFTDADQGTTIPL